MHDIAKDEAEELTEMQKLQGEALSHMHHGHPKEAIDIYEKALKLADKDKDLKARAMTLNNLGLAYHLRGDYDRTLEYYSNALKAATEAKDATETARSHHNLGTYYEAEREFELSITHLLISLAYQKEFDIPGEETFDFIWNLRKTLKQADFAETARKAYAKLEKKQQKLVDIDDIAGDKTVKYTGPRTGRNDPCPCGSGKKYKKCCGA